VSTLVNSVYSTVCDKYTENNDVIWNNPADPSLRGRPDFNPTARPMRKFADGIGETLMQSFVSQQIPNYCALSGFAHLFCQRNQLFDHGGGFDPGCPGPVARRRIARLRPSTLPSHSQAC